MPDAQAPRVLCIGAVLWDVIGRIEGAMARGDDRPGRIVRLPGGVALNIARGLARAGLRPVLLGAVGDDPEGAALLAAAAAQGLDATALTRLPGFPTDRYLAIEDGRGLVAAVADARTLEAAGTAILAPLADGRLAGPGQPWRGAAVLDGNLPGPLLTAIAAHPGLAGTQLRLVPASPGKAGHLVALMRAPQAVLVVNRVEAGLMLGRRFGSAATAAAALVAAGAARALVTDGARGAAEAMAGAATLVRPAPRVDVVRVTGAGDAFLAGHLAAELGGAGREAALVSAIAAAAAHVAGR